LARLAVLAGQAGQVRGGVVEAGDGLVELAARSARVGGTGQHQGSVPGDVVEPGFFQRPPQPRRGRFRGGELVGAVLLGLGGADFSRCAAWRQLSPQYLAGRPVAGRFRGRAQPGPAHRTTSSTERASRVP
jgi:hypothetical protein